MFFSGSFDEYKIQKNSIHLKYVFFLHYTFLFTFDELNAVFLITLIKKNIYIYLIFKQQYKHLMGDVNIWSRYNKLTRIDSHTDSMQQSL